MFGIERPKGLRFGDVAEAGKRKRGSAAAGSKRQRVKTGKKRKRAGAAAGNAHTPQPIDAPTEQLTDVPTQPPTRADTHFHFDTESDTESEGSMAASASEGEYRPKVDITTLGKRRASNRAASKRARNADVLDTTMPSKSDADSEQSPSGSFL